MDGSWKGMEGVVCGAAVLQCLLLPLLGQQQSGSGYGEGRELACDKRRLLCIIGE